MRLATLLFSTLLAFGMAACASSPDAEPDPAPVADENGPETDAPPVNACPIEGVEAVEISLPTTTGEPLMVNGLEHIRVWNDDLNGDGVADMILQQKGGCNRQDECFKTVWLGCSPNTFTAIWGPALAYELYVLEVDHTYQDETWSTLELLTIDAQGDTAKATLQFDGEAYSPVE